jgi:hypothetical protein
VYSIPVPACVLHKGGDCPVMIPRPMLRSYLLLPSQPIGLRSRPSLHGGEVCYPGLGRCRSKHPNGGVNLEPDSREAGVCRNDELGEAGTREGGTTERARLTIRLEQDSKRYCRPSDEKLASYTDANISIPDMIQVSGTIPPPSDSHTCHAPNLAKFETPLVCSLRD